MSLERWLVGSSEVMERLRAQVRCVAAADYPVLVTGPNGAGKERVVQAIHELGRAAEPLHDVDCASIPAALMESQLFGHRRGAFSGADEDRPGALQAAGRGTLFLDEVGELAPEHQAKLLRTLETRRFRPVGEVRDRAFEGRLVTATMRDLAAMVAARTFREDLYYRLQVLTVRVPALDEHKEDLPELIACFLAGRPRQLTFTRGAIEALQARRWPGNVRQLRSVIDRLSVYATSDVVRAEDLTCALDAEPHAPSADPPSTLERLVEEVIRAPIAGDKLEQLESLVIARALELTGGNKTRAGELLGVHRKRIERRVDAPKEARTIGAARDRQPEPELASEPTALHPPRPERGLRLVATS